MIVVLIVLAAIVIALLWFAGRESHAAQSIGWTDFTMVHHMRLVKASRAEYKGYKFLVFEGRPGLWDLHITKDEQQVLRDPIAGHSMRETKTRVMEAIEAIEYMESKP